jgi:FkbM family methyltransferase
VTLTVRVGPDDSSRDRGGAIEPGHRWVRSALNYLRVWPTTSADAIRLCRAYLKTVESLVDKQHAFGSVGERLQSPGPLKVRFGDLEVLVRPHSEDLAIITGNHEPGVLEWFHPHRGELVVDAGAHIGSYSLRAALRGAQVIAFEPNPDTYRILLQNIELNHLDGIEPRCAALGSAAGTAEMVIPAVYLGRASIGRRLKGESTTVVPVARLDDELRANRHRPIDWLKIDVEGSEVDLLRGASEVLARTRRVILEVDHGHESECERILLRDGGFVRRRQIIQPTQDYWLLEQSTKA